jgi:hypothetical protein
MLGLMPASRYLFNLAMSPFMIESMVSVRTTVVQACRLHDMERQGSAPSRGWEKAGVKGSQGGGEEAWGWR